MRSYRRQVFRVHYPATKEICCFSVEDKREDFLSGDLWVK